jgi:hypothetical protein
LLVAIYRLIMVWKKPSMMAWQDANTMHWGEAIRKSTPLRAALARSIPLESGARLGLAVGQVLWDSEAFFDSFAVTGVTRMAVRLGCPRRLLSLALQQHTAPRIVAAMGAADTIHGANEGVLLGDAQSMNFAKIVTAQLLAQMHALDAASGSHGVFPTVLGLLATPPPPPLPAATATSSSSASVPFGTPCQAHLDIWRELKAATSAAAGTDVDFDLVYAPRAFELLRDSFERDPAFWHGAGVLYYHCGGTEGTESQLGRYRHAKLLTS